MEPYMSFCIADYLYIFTLHLTVNYQTKKKKEKEKDNKAEDSMLDLPITVHMMVWPCIPNSRTLTTSCPNYGYLSSRRTKNIGPHQ